MRFAPCGPFCLVNRPFTETIGEVEWPGINLGALMPPHDVARGHFLTFDCADAAAIDARLAAAGIRVDQRGTRIRLGFGVYHPATFVDALFARLALALKG